MNKVKAILVLLNIISISSFILSSHSMEIEEDSKCTSGLTIGIVGATGHVGESTAYTLIYNNPPSRLLLWGRNQYQLGLLADEIAGIDSKSEVTAVSSLEELSHSDIIIITAGLKQQPGETRDQLLVVNKNIIQDIINRIARSQEKNNNALIMMLTNPVEDLAQCALTQAQELGYLHNPERQIIGSGTLLDTKRLHTILRKKYKLRTNLPLVLGEHGDDQFVAWSNSSLECRRLSNIEKEQTEKETREKAYKIIAQRGWTQYVIAYAVTLICRSIHNQQPAHPISSFHPDHKVFLSLPTYLNERGVVNIKQMHFTRSELKKLDKCIKKRKTIRDEILRQVINSQEPTLEHSSSSSSSQ